MYVRSFPFARLHVFGAFRTCFPPECSHVFKLDAPNQTNNPNSEIWRVRLQHSSRSVSLTQMTHRMRPAKQKINITRWVIPHTSGLVNLSSRFNFWSVDQLRFEAQSRPAKLNFLCEAKPKNQSGRMGTQSNTNNFSFIPTKTLHKYRTQTCPSVSLPPQESLELSPQSFSSPPK